MEAAPPGMDLPRQHARFPVWWRLLMTAGLIGCLVISRVDEAASYLLLVATSVLGILILLVHYLCYGESRFSVRALPLIGFVGLLGTIAWTLRVDDMTGNLVPTRVSFRWQLQHDELLEIPQATIMAEGIDLATTTENDFPEFLGPGRAAYVNVALSADWSVSKPELVWEKDQFGAGWSGFAVVNGYAVTLEQRGEHELVDCYEIVSGDLVWSTGVKARHLTVPGGIGPRSTPTIYNGRVYTLGATGILLCIDGSNGNIIWQKNLLDETGTTLAEDVARVAWGRAASPLVDRGRVIVPLGGPNGCSLVAYDAVNGDELWRQGNHQVSYASPLFTTLAGVQQIVILCEDYVCGHDSESGEQLWEFAWPGKSNSDASCSQPVPAGGSRLFLSKGYTHGAALIDVGLDEDGHWSATEIWHRRSVMKTKFTNVVLLDGYVYGLDGSILSCIDLKSGQRKWKRGRYGHGQVLRAGDKLLVQAESGDVALVALNPHGFQELARFAPLDGKTWNNPCLYGEYLLVRNGAQAACYRLPLEYPGGTAGS